MVHWRVLHVYGSDPALSPDGTKIAYCSVRESIYSQVYVMNIDGTAQKRLTKIATGDSQAFSKQQDFCFPAWSLDGKEIAFTALNRLGPQGIVKGEERPRCELWSGEYQIFTFDGGGSIHRLTDAKLMGMRPSYGRVASR